MRALIGVLIWILLLPANSNPERTTPPTVSADTIALREVRRASEIGAFDRLGDTPDTLLVERPVDARAGATSSVFVADEAALLLRRVRIVYGRASPSLIQVLSGVSPGERIVVSDMRAWDAYDQLQFRLR